MVTPVAAGLQCVDLDHLRRPQVIAAGVIDCGDGLAIVDPGPGSTFATLTAKLASLGAAVTDVRAVLLTHIHLDHAGASGAVAEASPNCQVYVHERGARHMLDPSRLMASATRLYGNRMKTLWGAFLPVPTERLTALTGGEVLELGARTLDVAYTPGHAWHHVSYLDRATGTAFSGDVGGCRIAGSDYAMPPTPPPGIDVEAWHDSIALLRSWAPERLFATHFGPIDRVSQHLDEVSARLDRWSAWVSDHLDDADDDVMSRRFVAFVEGAMRRAVGDDRLESLLQAAPPDTCWFGLARYHRKRQG